MNQNHYKPAGIILQAAMEELYPELRLAKLAFDAKRPYVEFAGFLDEVQSPALQKQVDEQLAAHKNPSFSIKIGPFDYTDGNTRIHYQVSPEETPAKPDKAPEPAAGLKPQIDKLLSRAKADRNRPDFQVTYLGKKGRFNELARQLKDIDPNQRKEAGQRLNQLKQELELMAAAKPARQPDASASLDLTLPGQLPALGYLHPISKQLKILPTSLKLSALPGSAIRKSIGISTFLKI
jgi:hypothetical protein